MIKDATLDCLRIKRNKLQHAFHLPFVLASLVLALSLVVTLTWIGSPQFVTIMECECALTTLQLADMWMYKSAVKPR